MRTDSLTALTQRLAFLSYVEKNPGVSIETAAQSFCVSTAEIRKWVDTLWTVGYRRFGEREALPNHMIDFDGSAYEAGELLLTSSQNAAVPLSLAPDDADLVLSLLITLYPFAVIPQEIAASLTVKLAQIAPSERTVRAVKLNEAEQQQLAQVLTVRGIIAEAISSNRRVEVHYTDAGHKHSVRELSPVKVDWSGPAPILLAWCHTRQGVRRLRLDRISDVMLLGQPRSHVKRAQREGFSISADEEAIVTLVSPAPFALESLGWPETKLVSEGKIQVRVPVADYAWLTRWLLVHSESVLDIQPDKVKAKVLELIPEQASE
ncbi:hypothetical protein BM477_03620 [Boudabousia marimammalium]|uniref:WYL domain-containing protein n=1 Tax=Boudabousia marimammalium TaxID=156892 RepID=A0A1Q5PQZ8_9ACTO|nr:hypothetical protein BM477_03620 [Boudabousia marimammalium]